MKTNKKKSPSDYPMFSFRVSEDDKEMLNIQIEKAVKLLNKKLDEDEKVIRKNDIIVEALNLGLSKILKKKSEALGALSNFLIPDFFLLKATHFLIR